MALSDAKRLYDITTRQAVYIEGVKLGMQREFNDSLAVLKDEFDKILRRVRYKTLDGVTKVEILKLIGALKRVQTQVYSQYTEKLLNQLEDFTAINLEVARRTMVAARMEEETPEDDQGEYLPTDAEAIAFIEQHNEQNAAVIPLFGIAAALKRDAIWQKFTNTVMPANGIYPLQFVKNFAASAQAATVNRVMQAWADKESVESLAQALTGLNAPRARQGVSDVLRRVGVQNSAVVATLIQQAAAVSNAAVQSAIWELYQWHSVIDAATTVVCRGRNGNVYRYGEGPLPPAHINCRSHISPYMGKIDPETYFAWLFRQPESVKRDILGAKLAKDFEDGKVKAKDLQKFDASRPMSLDEFREKVADILAR